MRIPVGYLQSAEAGIRPGGRPPFLCATRKEAKKRAPQPAAPAGQPAPGCLRGAPHNSLRCCAAAFGQMRRVRSRSGCVLRHTRHPASTPPQAQSEGGCKPDTGHRCARPQALGRAQRWHVGCSFPGFPSGCAEERSGQRIRARDCLSATQWSEFERDPAGREHRRLPAAKRRDAACRGALSLVTFFRRRERKLLACRATPGLRPQPKRSVRYQKYSYYRNTCKR